MILKFHLKSETDGLLLLQSPPIRRVIYGNNGFKPVDHPSLLFTIRYLKHSNMIFFPGIYGSGLRVFATDDSFENEDSKVIYYKHEFQRKGLVCTEHNYDGNKYKSVKDLVNHVISLWWGHIHQDHSCMLKGICSLKYKEALKEASADKVGIYYPDYITCKNYLNTYKATPDFILPKKILFVSIPWKDYCDETP